jgi:hypothetical protein
MHGRRNVTDASGYKLMLVQQVYLRDHGAGSCPVLLTQAQAYTEMTAVGFIWVDVMYNFVIVRRFLRPSHNTSHSFQR